MKLYEAGRVMTQFTWQTQEQYATTLRTAATADELRMTARELWGSDWTQTVLGF